MTRVLVVISGEDSIETVVLVGNGLVSNKFKSSLTQLTNNVPYPLAEHIKTPLNGAAAVVSMGWMMMRGAGTVY